MPFEPELASESSEFVVLVALEDVPRTRLELESMLVLAGFWMVLRTLVGPVVWLLLLVFSELFALECDAVEAMFEAAAATARRMLPKALLVRERRFVDPLATPRRKESRLPAELGPPPLSWDEDMGMEPRELTGTLRVRVKFEVTGGGTGGEGSDGETGSISAASLDSDKRWLFSTGRNECLWPVVVVGSCEDEEGVLGVVMMLLRLALSAARLPVAPRPDATAPGPRSEAIDAPRRVSSLMAAIGRAEEEEEASGCCVSTAGVMARGMERTRRL